MAAVKTQYDELWDYLLDLTANEKRSLKDILGQDSAERLLQQIEQLDIYDPATVRSFIQTPVFESMLGGILYEGIFEFLQRVDIIGNIVNNLPIIGPIRVAIVKEFKASLDRTVGKQIKVFLSSFNKVAVQRMADFVLSPQNRQSFSKANRNVADALLSRKLSELLSSSTQSIADARQNLWKTIVETPEQDVIKIVEYVYDQFGTVVFGTVFQIDVKNVLDKAPTVKQVISANMGRFLQSEQGKLLINSTSEMNKKLQD